MTVALNGPMEQIVVDAPAGLPDLRIWVDGLCR